MKNLLSKSPLYFLFVVMAISCSKKDDPAPPAPATPAAPDPTKLIGNWIIVTESRSGCDNTADNGTDACSFCDVLTFKATTWSNSGSNPAISKSGTYVVNEDKIFFTQPGAPTETNTFSFTGTTLTLVREDIASGCKVTRVFAKYNVETLVGSWKVKSQTRTGCTDPTDNFSITCPGSNPVCDTVTFAEMTYVYVPDSGSGVGPFSGTFRISGNKLTMIVDGAPITFDYTVSAATLTFSQTMSASTHCKDTTTLTKV